VKLATESLVNEVSPPGNQERYGFRPWVRRAGASIVLVALLVSVLMLGMLRTGAFRYGWVREPFSWVYVGVLWLGGLRIYSGTLRDAAEISGSGLSLRPLHRFSVAVMPWDEVVGTEQMIGGDRLIVYYQRRGNLRFVAMNMNLVRGRRNFMSRLDGELRARGFAERVIDRSRYLTRPGGGVAPREAGE